MTLMSIWAACQPRPVTPQPGDVVQDGRRYRRIDGGWAVYIAQSGDWYRCDDPTTTQRESAGGE